MAMTEAERRRYAFYEAQFYSLSASNQSWKQAYSRLADENRRLREECEAMKRQTERGA